jgi:hypothetical protein
MRALAIVAIVALGPSVIEARAADLRVGGPAMRGPEYVYEQVPVCSPGPFYGFCVPHYGPIGYPYYGPIGYRFIGRSHVYLPDFPRCRTMLVRTPDGSLRRLRHCT